MAPALCSSHPTLAVLLLRLSCRRADSVFSKTLAARATLHQPQGTSQPQMGLSTYGRAVRVPAGRFAQPAPRGAAGALQRAGILPVLPSAVATLPIKVEKLSMLCSSALDRVFPEASHAVCQARRAACRKALGSAPNEKDSGWRRDGSQGEFRAPWVLVCDKAAAVAAAWSDTLKYQHRDGKASMTSSVLQ